MIACRLRLVLVAATLLGLAGCGDADGARAPTNTAETRFLAFCRANPGACDEAVARGGRDPFPGGRAGSCRPSARYEYASGATGMYIAHFTVREPSRRGCTLTGFPTLQMIDRRGRALATRTSQRTGIPIGNVRVRRGHPGHFTVEYRYTEPDGQGCRPAHALEVRLPGDERPITVSVERGHDPDLRPFTPCGGRLGVGPIVGR